MNPHSDHPEFLIRPYQDADHDALYRICLQTGDSGNDASTLYRDANLLGHIYAGPYFRFAPELAFVLEDRVGPCGYVVSAFDTRAFNEKLEQEWWPALRFRYLLTGHPPDDFSADQRLIALLHRGFREEDEALLRDYPSHLHVDLLPRAQGKGLGKRLMNTVFRALAQAGSSGVHLGVGERNQRAIGFYRHLGFKQLARRQGALFFGLKLTPEMGMELSPAELDLLTE